MKLRSNFVTFILTHGRPDKVWTYDTLRSNGYTGPIVFVVDNEDNTIEQYRQRYSLKDVSNLVYMFDKLDISRRYDTVDNGSDRRSIFYARNACFEIAEELGYKYFLELDDDYTCFRSRRDKDGKFTTTYHRDLDSLFEVMLQFLDTSKAHTVAFSQTGDFIGGMGSRVFKQKLARKAMNSFFCTIDRPFKFTGRINEDVNTYVLEGSRGKLLFTVADATLDQKQTQSNSGGMTELYLNSGTYVKSFFTIITNPSSAKIHVMGQSHKRIHHVIDWEHAVPKIISGEFKKGADNEEEVETNKIAHKEVRQTCSKDQHEEARRNQSEQTYVRTLERVCIKEETENEVETQNRKTTGTCIEGYKRLF